MAKIELLDESSWKSVEDGATEAGFGCMRTPRGHLPLQAMGITGRIHGLYFANRLEQTFVNVFQEALEATYIFPLPDRAAVSRFRLKVAGRIIEGELQDRGAARKTYDTAIASGHRAAIAEEERPGVFTMRAGNIPAGESVTVELELAGPLQVADGEATFRFPLVVAPRYIPGIALDGASVGAGTASDTDAVPDASRITPPVLLPGQPNPVALTLAVQVDPAGLRFGALRSSLHQLEVTGEADGLRTVRLRPDTERLDRDFLLRFDVSEDTVVSSLAIQPDADPESEEGTFALTIVPPSLESTGTAPRDVVIVLDRSGSMSGWKMVAARRAAGRLLDTLTPKDRFAVVLFDDRIDQFQSEGSGLLAASDRNRYRAVEFLSKANDRGGTEMGRALNHSLALFDRESAERQRSLVFITDGQVGNEDQLLWQVRRQAKGIRIHAIGIDRAVNGAFLRRLAVPTQGVCELVESEDRLDDAMRSMYHRVASPVLTGVHIDSGWSGYAAESISPRGECDVFPGVPAVLYARYSGKVPEYVLVRGTKSDGSEFRVKVPVVSREGAPVTLAWARARVLDLEHQYVTSGERDRGMIDQITALSLRFGVLCRFTAFVAVDREEVVNPGGDPHKVTQSVEPADGWDMLAKKDSKKKRSMKLEEVADERTMFASMGACEDFDAEECEAPEPADFDEGTYGGPTSESLDECLYDDLNEVSLGSGGPPVDGFGQASGGGLGGALRGDLLGSFDFGPTDKSLTRAGGRPGGPPEPPCAEPAPMPASPSPAKPFGSSASTPKAKPAPSPKAPASSPGGPLSSFTNMADMADDALSGISTALGKMMGKKRRRKATPEKKARNRFRSSFESLLENGIGELRRATDAEAVWENLAYLIADLGELIRGLTSTPNLEELTADLTQAVADLEVLAETKPSPQSPDLTGLLDRLEEILRGDALAPDRGAPPPPSREFWK